MGRALIVIQTESDRRKCADWAFKAPIGTRVEWKASKRSLPQNDLMWSLLTEVSEQVVHHGIRLSPEDWKLVFLDALKRENRLVPNLNGKGFVSLGRSSSDLSKAEMTDLIELIFEFGARNGVQFREQEHARAS